MSLARRVVIGSVVLAVGAAGMLPRQAGSASSASKAPAGYVPIKILEKPVPFRTGIGNAREAVATSSSKAQRYYDQGLNYLDSFVWIEAARSFHEALRLDPDLTLAYVGLSRAETGLDNPAGARFYLTQAQAIVSRRTAATTKLHARERRMVAIREKQVAALEDLRNLTKLEAYRGAIDEALAADLEDPRLWLLRGIASEASAAGQGQHGTAASIPYYERVLELAPDDASAHHYLIHSYETVARGAEALKHAEAYARLAPTIPHAAHMLAHALRRERRLDDAIAKLLQADAQERAYSRAERIDPALDWHHEHNLEVLRSAYEEKGRMDLAESVVRELAGLGVGDANREFQRRVLPEFLLHRARLEEALRESRAMLRAKHPQARAAGHALAGRALVRLGRLKEAGHELDEARRELERVPKSGASFVPRRGAVAPLVEDLREEYERAKGGPPSAPKAAADSLTREPHSER